MIVFRYFDTRETRPVIKRSSRGPRQRGTRLALSCGRRRCAHISKILQPIFSRAASGRKSTGKKTQTGEKGRSVFCESFEENDGQEDPFLTARFVSVQFRRYHI